MSLPAKILKFAKIAVKRNGLKGLVYVLKKKFGFSLVEFAFSSTKEGKVKTAGSNKILNRIDSVNSSSFLIDGAKIELPFLVNSSDLLPVPLALYKKFKDSNIKGAYINSFSSGSWICLFGCFSETFLKLTDEDLTLIDSLIAAGLTKKMEELDSLVHQQSSEEINNVSIRGSGFYYAEVDEKFNLIHVSGDLDKLFNCSSEELENILNSGIAELLDEADKWRLIRTARQVLKTQEPRSVSFHVRKPSTNLRIPILALIGCANVNRASQPKNILVGIGVINTRSETSFNLFNLEASNCLFRLLCSVSEKPNDYKSHFEHLDAFLRSVLPPCPTMLFINKNGKNICIRSDIGKETNLRDYQRIVGCLTPSSELIREFFLDDHTKAIVLSLNSGIIRGYYVYFVRASFPKAQSIDSLKLAASIASNVLEMSGKTHTQNRLIKYQMSLNRQLSKLWSIKNIFDLGSSVLELVSKIMPSKRGWFGVLSTNRTHIEGVAGFGAGVGLKLSRSQVELVLRHDYLDEAVSTGKIQIVPAGAQMECSGFNEVIKRLKIGTFVILPVNHKDKVIAVIIIEPHRDDYTYLRMNLPLLEYVSFYLGLVINALKFEYKIFEADKMKAISVFSAGLAHYLNNVFQSVVGNLSLIEREIPQALKPTFESILNSVQRGATLVRKLNDIASPSVKNFELIDLNVLIQESLDLFNTVLEPRIKVELQLKPGLRAIFGNKGSIQQAMLNIILNAKDALAEKNNGIVLIQTSDVKLVSNQIDPLLPPGRYVCVKICDNGKGMTEEELQSCFEPFFSTKGSNDILWPGLGLSTTYSIMRAHGGLATVASQKNMGTTVSLYFPYPMTSTLSEETEKPVVYLASLDQKLITELRSMLNSLGMNTMVYSRNGPRTIPDRNAILIIDLDTESSGDFEIFVTESSRIYGIASEPTAHSEFKHPIFKKPVNIWRLAQLL
ncbi:MAG: ATP-binding protein [Deltaproteobacteria bacterium]|nr:ATP-binding protein [Deltaproteobacteria bacterium]